MLNQGYITVNTVLARLRLNPYIKESFNKITAINLIGQCLNIINVKEVMEKAVELVDIQDYKGEIPQGLKRIIQSAYTFNTNYGLSKKCGEDTCEYQTAITNYKVEIDSTGDCDSEKCCTIMVDRKFYERNSYMPVIGILDSQEKFQGFKPIYPSVNSFGLYLSRKDANNNYADNYADNGDESYIVTKEYIETSFKKGKLLIAYLKSPMDDEGYPYIINDELVIQCCEKYYLFKTLQWKVMSGIDVTFTNVMLRTNMIKSLEQDFEDALLQVKGKAKFPNKEQMFMAYKNINTLLPNDNKFNSFFGYF